MSIFDSIKRFGRDQMLKRERRLMDPVFLASIEREKTEFVDILKTVGDRTFKSVASLFMDAGGSLIRNSIRLLFEKEYKLGNLTADTSKSLFGDNKAVDHAWKAILAATHLSGKTLKIGARKLTAI